MHLEIQVALNFVISYLYNKLPRRRVNLFGEELERALQRKFDGHWYPEKPFKGSAFRGLRVSTPLDPMLESAARESGLEVRDLRDNLPDELSVWIDPGEVSYRIGERGAVKVLVSERDIADDGSMDGEVTRTFNPEAQCFRPIDAVSSTLGGLVLTPMPSSATSPTSAAMAAILVSSSSCSSSSSSSSCSSGSGANSPVTTLTSSVVPSSPHQQHHQQQQQQQQQQQSTSPIAAFLPCKSSAPPPLTFTTATFAQTKFGSTKLKSSGKRPSRLSPTEFSNYIKQRALLQQHHQQLQRPRSLSPNPAQQQAPTSPAASGDPFVLMGQHLPFGSTGSYLGDLLGASNGIVHGVGGAPGYNGGVVSAAGGGGGGAAGGDGSKSLLDGLNFNLNAMPYPNPHQHLLVAN